MEDPTQVAPAIPSEPVGSQLGPNEFQERYDVDVALHNQAAASLQPESGQPTQTIAPEGSEVEGVTPSNESFLDESEQAQFDTNSPEYKAMQASFTKKTQELAQREAALAAQSSLVEQRLASIEASLAGQHQPEQAQESVNWEGFRPTTQLSEELQPYQEELLSLVREVGTHMVTQLQDQADRAYQTQQRGEFQQKLEGQVAELRSGPDASDFTRYQQDVLNVATENPNLIQRVGVKGILDMVRGYSAPPAPAPVQPQPTAPGYGNGVQDTLAAMQARKTSAVDNIQPMGAPAAGPPQGIPAGTSLNDAVKQAFQAATRGPGG